MSNEPFVEEWQREVDAYLEREGRPTWLVPRLEISYGPDHALEVIYDGVSWETPFRALCQLLRQPEQSRRLTSLMIRGPDRGANGTRDWHLSLLLEDLDEGEPRVLYPLLHTLSVDRTHPGDHNQSVLGDMGDEAGVLGRILDRAPQLRRLTVPSAPAPNFFDRPSHPLVELSVQAGYDTQGFVRELARSRCFTALTRLEYEDSAQHYRQDYRATQTAARDFEMLFSSTSLPALRELKIGSSCLAPRDASRYRETRLGRKLEQLTILRGVSLDWQVDEPALAQWDDGYFYPARIAGSQTDQAAFPVRFADGTEGLAYPPGLRDLHAATGEAVECRWQGGSGYYPAVIASMGDGRARVVYQDETEEETAADMIRVRFR